MFFFLGTLGWGDGYSRVSVVVVNGPLEFSKFDIFSLNPRNPLSRIFRTDILAKNNLRRVLRRLAQRLDPAQRAKSTIIIKITFFSKSGISTISHFQNGLLAKDNPRRVRRRLAQRLDATGIPQGSHKGGGGNRTWTLRL